MALEQYQNEYTTTLNESLSNNDTTITVTAAPSDMTGPFRVRIDNELILVNGISGNDFTGCVRGVEGTSAVTHTNGATVSHVVTAFTYNSLSGFVEAYKSTGRDFETSTLGGTAIGSPTTIDADTTYPGKLYIEKSANSAYGTIGRYWSISSDFGLSLPATFETDLQDAELKGNFSRHGLFIAEATPGKCVGIYVEVNGAISTISSTTPTTGAAYVTAAAISNVAGAFPMEFRIVVNSSSSVDFYWKPRNGLFWRQIGGNYNPGFTVASVGLTSNPESASFGVKSVWNHLWGY